MTQDRYQKAIAAFDNANAQDPNKEMFDGKEFPKELRPGKLSVVVLSIGFVFYVYIIFRALVSFFGKAS